MPTESVAEAFVGSLLLPMFGVRVTPLAGMLFTLAALAVALGEPRLATRRRSQSSAPELATLSQTVAIDPSAARVLICSRWAHARYPRIETRKGPRWDRPTVTLVAC